MAGRLTADIQAIIRHLISSNPQPPIRYWLTGESGQGKTVWCLRLIETARQSGLTLGGVVSPGVYEGGRQVAIQLRDIATDDTRRLAQLRPRLEPNQPTKKWKIDPEAVGWGNRVLERLGQVDLLILDELGPLELVHEQGLQEALRTLDRGEHRAALVVVRPSLLELATQRWPGGQVLQLPA